MTDKDEIASFLRDNPEFFEEFPDVLERVAQENGNGGSPFIERQLGVLKDREVQQQKRIDMIIDSVRSNQKLEQDLIVFTSALLDMAREVKDARGALLGQLQKQFNSRSSVLVLVADEPGHPHYQELRQRVGHGGSICDDRVSSGLLRGVFEDEADTIGSCAFIPVKSGNDVTGVIILGSTDGDRFRPDMGVGFLDNLGVIISSFLRGHGVL